MHVPGNVPRLRCVFVEWLKLSLRDQRERIGRAIKRSREIGDAVAADPQQTSVGRFRLVWQEVPLLGGRPLGRVDNETPDSLGPRVWVLRQDLGRHPCGLRRPRW